MRRTCGFAAAAVVLVAVAGCAAPTADLPARAEPAVATATVLRAVDGDTVDIRDDQRRRLRIRLLGVDAPEVHRPGWSVGCWGPEAARYAQDMLVGQRVAVVSDPTQDRVDRYGRTLAYLDLADGRDFAVEAARSGMVENYVFERHPVQRAPDIAAAEADAKAARRGLWGPPCNGETASVPT
jgi:micrococcal nuclease